MCAVIIGVLFVAGGFMIHPGLGVIFLALVLGGILDKLEGGVS